jgi:hypothetical protein
MVFVMNIAPATIHSVEAIVLSIGHLLLAKGGCILPLDGLSFVLGRKFGGTKGKLQ